MAHAWVPTAEDAHWEPIALDGPLFALEHHDGALVVHRDDPSTTAEVTLVRSSAPDATRETWVVVAATGAVRINGQAPVGGIGVVFDRDEIRPRGGPSLFLSLERPAREETARDRDHGTTCPRCTLPIERDHTIVRCPECDFAHHYTPARPCWTYEPTCARCPHPTALDTQHCWSPAQL